MRPIAACLVGLLAAVSLAAEPTVETEEICRVDIAGIVPHAIAVSPDARHIAVVERLGPERRVVLDGAPHERWDAIPGRPVFSPDSRRLAYVARRGFRDAVVLDGKAGPLTDGIVAGTPVFSADGRHLAYAAKDRARQAVVIDGVRQARYDTVQPYSLALSADGAHHVYAARDGVHWRVVRDGRPGRGFEGVVQGTVALSADGRRWAAGVLTEAGEAMLIDARRQTPFERVRTFVFSPDGAHHAYTASERDRWFVVRDGRRLAEYDLIPAAPQFGPRGRRLAYVARKGEGTFVVVDDTPLGPYRHVLANRVTFSADGAHVAFVVQDEIGSVLMRNGEPVAQHPRILPDPVFGPGGRRLAYAGTSGLMARSYIGAEASTRLFNILFVAPQGTQIHFEAPATLRYMALANGTVYRVLEKRRP